jgi:poly(3-hydroxybutyrate) depolymerase
MLFSSVSLLTRFLALATFSSAQTTTSSTSVCPSIVNDIPILATLSLTAVVDTDLYLPGDPPVSNACTPTATVTLKNGTPTVVSRVPPILEFHGGSDKTIPYNGGLGRANFCLPTIPHWIQQWAARDNLPVTNTTSAITSEATAFIFGSSTTDGLVMHVFDGPDVSHSWPATFLNDDNQPPGCGPFGGGDGNGDGPASFNATPMIISFFNEWPRTRLT